MKNRNPSCCPPPLPAPLRGLGDFGTLLRFLALLLAVPSGHATTQTPPPLPPEEIQFALVSEEISIPSPGEFFTAVSRSGRPNWSAAGRCGTNLNATSRRQIALNIGALISDGYLAVEQQNSQEVKNIGRDILAMARKLNASDSVLARGRSINEFAENNEWNTLREELEATQNEIKLILIEQKDEPLLALISAGAWLRGIQTVALAEQAAPSPAVSALFYQPSVVDALLLRLKALPEKEAGEPLPASLISSMESIREILRAQSGGAPSPESIAKISALTGELLAAICNPAPVSSSENPPPPPAPEQAGQTSVNLQK